MYKFPDCTKDSVIEPRLLREVMSHDTRPVELESKELAADGTKRIWQNIVNKGEAKPHDKVSSLLAFASAFTQSQVCGGALDSCIQVRDSAANLASRSAAPPLRGYIGNSTPISSGFPAQRLATLHKTIDKRYPNFIERNSSDGPAHLPEVSGISMTKWRESLPKVYLVSRFQRNYTRVTPALFVCVGFFFLLF